MLSGVAIMDGVEVEVVELGLTKIEQRYLAAKGAIKVDDTIVISSDSPASRAHSANWEAHTTVRSI